jgi:putative Mg2+ transporter-C (MgtC) family protein
MITHWEMIARIATGAALGGVIGFERDIHGRQVGLRTHLLVAMASATFMVVSNHFIYFQGYDDTQHVEVDASRIAASVVSGIGFLAGGAILKTGATIQGLTTAAGLWLVTAIGLASGGGMYVEAGSVTLMGLVALTSLRAFEDKNDKLIRRHVSLVLADGDGEQVPRLMQKLSALGARVADFDYEKSVADRKVRVHFEVRIPVSLGVPQLIETLEKEAGMEQVHVKQRE